MTCQLTSPRLKPVDVQLLMVGGWANLAIIGLGFCLVAHQPVLASVAMRKIPLSSKTNQPAQTPQKFRGFFSFVFVVPAVLLSS
jgi:hypothetical protein